MTLRAVLTMTVLAATTCAAAPALHDAYSSAKAYAYTKQVTAFGERWPGSPGHKKTEDLIHSVLKAAGAVDEVDSFTAKTPKGAVEVHNIIGKFNVNPSDPNQPIVILAGHYDTLFKPGFVGANDGGSSTGIVLAFAEALKGQKTKMQVWLMWTDLEEAIESFQGDDGLYGSRHFAQKLKADGLVPRVRGFFLLDMIGDTDLEVSREQQSDPALQAIIAKAADELGYTRYFFQTQTDIIDDHKSFIDVGIPSVDVVDAEFGRMGNDPATGKPFDGMGEFHHANTDTIDKVSQKSLEIVGRTILRTVELMDAK
jgi:Zn-dependent M28 family amino/carboxypeptidase